MTFDGVFEMDAYLVQSPYRTAPMASGGFLVSVLRYRPLRRDDSGKFPGTSAAPRPHGCQFGGGRRDLVDRQAGIFFPDGDCGTRRGTCGSDR